MPWIPFSTGQIISCITMVIDPTRSFILIFSPTQINQFILPAYPYSIVYPSLRAYYLIPINSILESKYSIQKSNLQNKCKIIVILLYSKPLLIATEMVELAETSMHLDWLVVYLPLVPYPWILEVCRRHYRD